MINKTKKAVGITKEIFFDLVAPIHIYHKADIAWEKAAAKALKKLKKYRDAPIVIEYFGNGINVLNEKSINNVDYHVFWDIYDRLFKELVTESIPQLNADYDSYGAKCFRTTENGKTYLAGDDTYCFPFYADVSSLKNRIEDLRHEI